MFRINFLNVDMRDIKIWETIFINLIRDQEKYKTWDNFS